METTMSTLHVYQQMKWSEYVYQPYPKWVTKKNGDQVIVNSQREHIQLIATEGEMQDGGVNPYQVERDALMARLLQMEKELASLKQAKATEKAPEPAVVAKAPVPAPVQLSIDDLISGPSQ
jgi:hypothetical protein